MSTYKAGFLPQSRAGKNASSRRGLVTGTRPRFERGLVKLVIEKLTERDTQNQEQIQALEEKLDESDKRFGKLKRQFDAIMKKLGMNSGGNAGL